MKKIFLFLFAVAYCFGIQAQEHIYEKDLIGVWETVSSSGDFDCIWAPTEITFGYDGSCIYRDYYNTIMCNSFVVSSINKLHLFSSFNEHGYGHHTNINFTIDTFSPHEYMVLKDFNGKGNVKLEFRGYPEALEVQDYEIDESDLVGTWTGTMIGSFADIDAFNGITFREDGGGNLRLNPYGVSYFRLFFISNGNKLNLMFADKAMKFKILSYKKGESMQISDLSQKNLLVLFKQDTDGIASIRYHHQLDSTKYTLQGVPTTTPNGIYIQGGRKQIAK